MEETYSIEEVIRFTVNILSNISVPAALVESIGIPISNALKNLMVLLEAAPKEGKGEEDGRETDTE